MRGLGGMGGEGGMLELNILQIHLSIFKNINNRNNQMKNQTTPLPLLFSLF